MLSIELLSAPAAEDLEQLAETLHATVHAGAGDSAEPLYLSFLLLCHTVAGFIPAMPAPLIPRRSTAPR
jgi:hypothetical protein